MTLKMSKMSFISDFDVPTRYISAVGQIFVNGKGEAFTIA